MKVSWSKTVFPIAAIFSFRMLGLFLLIPVFTLYSGELRGATPALMGIALGAYGLSQGLLQMPFGILSDKWGRKPLISIGLTLFAIGSLMGALSDSIYGMIFARIIQGTGAIGSVLIALLADLTPDSDRTKAMAIIGMTIGVSFSLAMVLSPALTHHFGLSGIFYLTCGLACLGLIVLHWVIPTPNRERFHSDSEANPRLFKSVVTNRHLQRLNFGIFCQHFILTSTFFVIPLLLKEQTKAGHLSQTWSFYLFVILLAFIIMVPIIIYGEKKNKVKLIFLGSVLSTAVAQGLLIVTYQNWFYFCFYMLVFFTAFNTLEALLPSQISKQANPNSKGTAMGIYSTAQFLGIFAGGASAGFIYQWNGNEGIFLVNMLMSALWFVLAFSMENATRLNLVIPYNEAQVNKKQVQEQLIQLEGVEQVHFAVEEEVIYLQLNKGLYLKGSAEALLAKGAVNKQS